MASQEFLASFAVDIDESGVSRLQDILEENRDLADEVAAAFSAASAAIREYQAAAAKAREYMKQALDAEAEGADAREWADRVVETLREPLDQVRELYASFTFEDDPTRPGGENPEGSPLGASLDLEGAREELEAFREEAAEPVALTAGASGITSAARTAYNRVKNLFSTPIPIRATVQTMTDGGEEEDGTAEEPTVKMSSGGRSKPEAAPADTAP